VCCWGAAGNHNYTQNGAHKNTLIHKYIQLKCVHVRSSVASGRLSSSLSLARIHIALLLFHSHLCKEMPHSWESLSGSHCCACSLCSLGLPIDRESFVVLPCLAVLKHRCCASVALYAWWGAVQFALLFFVAACVFLSFRPPLCRRVQKSILIFH